MPRRVVFIGNRQVEHLSLIYRRVVSPLTSDQVSVMPSYKAAKPRDLQCIAEADIVVQQIQNSASTIEQIPTKARIVLVPHVTGTFLWPYGGKAHVSGPPDADEESSPYPSELGDSFLNRMIRKNIGPDEALRSYLAANVAKRVAKRAARLFELHIDQQRERDRLSGQKIAELIEQGFRQRQLFLSPNNLANPLFAAMIRSAFAALDVSERLVESSIAYSTKMKPSEAPIHPAVAAHFGLAYAGRDRRYRYMREGSFTFDEYVLRYMRFEYNDDLRRGLRLIHQHQYEAAADLLMRAVAKSPSSVAGRRALRAVLFRLGRLNDALRVSEELAALEPQNQVYRKEVERLMWQITETTSRSRQTSAGGRLAGEPAPDAASAELERQTFDENWYLAQNPGVAEAVRRGGFPSGWDHFIRHGRAEGRAPHPSAERPADIARSQPQGDFMTPSFGDHNGTGFLTPAILSMSETRLTRVAVAGACFAEGIGLHRHNPSGCPVDLFLINAISGLPEVAADIIASYDFLLVLVPFREIQRDDALWHLAHADTEAHEAALHRACKALEAWLTVALRWNREHGKLTFVANFLVPQQNPMGRLFPRFDLRNPEYFVARLNEHLEKFVLQHANAHVLDIDRLSASMGRRHAQDDALVTISHGALWPPAVYENPGRIEPIGPTTAYYDIHWRPLFPGMIWAEVVAMYRTIHQIDPVKLVVVDLDDTLWNGVSGDMAAGELPVAEGWALGVAEALQYLRKRGVLLAVISKNDESRIRDIWPKIFNGSLLLDEFAAIRINWRPKPENMQDILKGMNLLPRNTVFVDDNPAERAAMRGQFPDMRILGEHPCYLKRTLLWSSEAQVPYVTEESARRTEMIQAQFRREDLREDLPREAFLQRAAPKITLLMIDGTGHPRFVRAFELINKTNQFNTTGRRWTSGDCEAWFAGGGQMLAFDVTDSFSHYGLVGVAIFRGDTIEQWVMSCRVLGYQIEEGVMATIVTRMRSANVAAITGKLIRTNVNFPCQDLFARCGFEERKSDGLWTLAPNVAPAVPSHLAILEQDGFRPTLSAVLHSGPIPIEPRPAPRDLHLISSAARGEL